MGTLLHGYVKYQNHVVTAGYSQVCYNVTYAWLKIIVAEFYSEEPLMG